jgi:hypothetical protein
MITLVAWILAIGIVIACGLRWWEAHRDNYENIGPTVTFQVITAPLSVVLLAFGNSEGSITLSLLCGVSLLIHHFVRGVVLANAPC